jgi:hypothetical protein
MKLYAGGPGGGGDALVGAWASLPVGAVADTEGGGGATTDPTFGAGLLSTPPATGVELLGAAPPPLAWL